MNHEALGILTSLFPFLDWHGFFFLLFAGVACVAAVMVVLSDNVVRMALHLVLSLGATAGLFFSSRRRVCRCDAIDDLCWWNVGPARIRCNAHGSDSISCSADTSR